MKKPGRNDPCPCGSGKKFKKCCESKMLGGRFQAIKIESASPNQKTSSLTSLFHSSTAAIPKKTTPPPQEEEKPSEEPSEKPEDPQP